MTNKIPTHELLSQFVKHHDRVSTSYIKDRCDTFGWDEFIEDEMHSLRAKMFSAMITMVKYASCHEQIIIEAKK